MDIKQLVEDNVMVKMYAGSIAYGTNIATSDVDFRGLFCADEVNIRTPFYPVKEYTDPSEEDSKYYEVTNFMRLCLDCNPNIIEMLWTDESDIVFRTPAYDLLREHRSDFLSSKIAFTTSGYALSQLKRIKGHNKWINNPQTEEPPRQSDFIKFIQNFTNEKRFSIDVAEFRDDHRLVHYGSNIYGIIQMDGYKLYNPHSFSLNTNMDTVIKEDPEGIARKKPMFIIQYNKEEYKLALEKWRQYWDWKKNRNDKRSVLEEEHGFDTKHAMHLVRLLRIGVEALTEGVINVKRPDAQELLDIRNGSMSYDEIVDYATKMDEDIRNRLYKNTELRKKPDIKTAAKVLMEVQNLIWEPKKLLRSQV